MEVMYSVGLSRLRREVEGGGRGGKETREGKREEEGRERKGEERGRGRMRRVQAWG